MPRSQPARPLLTRACGAALAVLTVVAVVTVMLSAAGGRDRDAVTPTAAPAARTAAPDTDPQVLVISLDGFNPTVLRTLGHQGLPHLWRLFDEGAGTLDARTQVELTITLPNHTSMVTGRRIDARRGGHGVTWNDDRLRPRTVQRAAGHPVASVFTRVHAEGGSTALYAAKTKFSLWPRSWPRAIDRVGIHEEDDRAVVADARADLVAADRALTFMHLGDADKTGHASGWLSPAYLDAVRRLDRLVGLVLHDADQRPELDDLTIVLTADHGGVPGTTSHSDVRRPADYTIPFVVWGPGITHADLYDLNPGYRDPGTSRPSLKGKQPVRNGDVANLALSLLGDDPVPGSLFGRVRPLRVR
ncbi:alkaline phosphatase family protein [Nocardioides rubriscoriae]|uniref:alkaline phosphatase family protein n=1 Tax=Nocardioides rubriscoriae TaxID=642762 RepID=UPI0011DF20E5|nr:alkaline phosphatase family protein [Nocardioides rubriscoriae]